MKRAICFSLWAAISSFGFAAGAALAQPACPEGRTANGQCVNAGLADALRQTAIIFSQPKLSQTHYPVLPSEDRRYRYPYELNPDPLKPSPVGTPVPPPSP